MPEGHVTVVPVDRGPSSTAAAPKQVEILSLSLSCNMDVLKRELKIFYFLAKKKYKKSVFQQMSKQVDILSLVC